MIAFSYKVDIPQVFIHNLIFNPVQAIKSLLFSLQADLRSVLPQIQAPCLILWSEKDLAVPLSIAQEFSQLIHDSRLVTVSEGFHEWVLLHPEKFVSIVSSFIAENEGNLNKPKDRRIYLFTGGQLDTERSDRAEATQN